MGMQVLSLHDDGISAGATTATFRFSNNTVATIRVTSHDAQTIKDKSPQQARVDCANKKVEFLDGTGAEIVTSTITAAEASDVCAKNQLAINARRNSTSASAGHGSGTGL